MTPSISAKEDVQDLHSTTDDATSVSAASETANPIENAAAAPFPQGNEKDAVTRVDTNASTTEYPDTKKLILIMCALYLAVFLVALVGFSSTLLDTRRCIIFD